MLEKPNYVRASLIDRLIDETPKQEDEAMPLRVQTPAQLKISLRRDLEWLLNTRCPLAAESLDWNNRSVLDYGIPDFGTAFTRNPEDWRRIADILEKTIRAYEPRLQEVKVRISRARNNTELVLGLEARLVVGDVDEPVSFPMLLQSQGNASRISLL